VAGTQGRVICLQSGGAQLLERRLEHRAVTGIDAQTVGNTTVFTTDADYGRFVVTLLVLFFTSVTGLTLLATTSLGYAAANYDQISAAAQISANGTNKYELRVPGDVEATGSNSVAASTAVVLRVNPAGTGTTQTLSTYVQGFYIG